MINEDIDAIIHHGEERTAEINSKYEGLNFEDLNNFKSDTMVQQWEGEDFRTGVNEIMLGVCLTAHMLRAEKKCGVLPGTFEA